MKKTTLSILTVGAFALGFNAEDVGANSDYIVKKGDTLWKIASSNKVTVDDLKKINELADDIIYPNQVLKLNDFQYSQSNSPRTDNSSNEYYVVKPGDTLSKIAGLYKTTVAKIQSDNNISEHLIYPGQKVILNERNTSPNSNESDVSSKIDPESNNQEKSHVVVAGDTLNQISYEYGVSVTQLKNWNNIDGHLIKVGQVLKVENTAVETQPNKPPINPTPSSSPNKDIQAIIDLAKSYMGVPYVWGGSTPNGFDCSGYLYYVYSNSGVPIPRTNIEGLHARAYEVSNPEVGDIIFFKDTYKKGPSHAGIYLGNGQFIHAGGDRVQISSVNDSYWKKHFDSYKRFYAMD